MTRTLKRDNSQVQSPVRIIHIRNARGITDITGAETYLLYLIDGLNRRNCKSMLLCSVDPARGDTNLLKELARKDFDCQTVPVRSWIDFRDVIGIVKSINTFQADIVHSHDHRADIATALAAKITRRPFVATFHGWTNFEPGSIRARLYPLLDRAALRYAHTVISVSAAEARNVKFEGRGPKQAIIHNGIDPDRYNPQYVQSDTKQFFANEDAVPILGMVGRIHPNKGQMEFVQAAADLIRDGLVFKILILGKTPLGYEAYEKQMKRFLTENGLDHVVRVASVSPVEVPSVLSMIDIVVAPSFMESLSFTLLEAMAMEKAIVTTPVGGTPEIISDGETGLLVPPGDREELARALKKLLSSPERRRELGLKARNRVLADLTVEKMVSKTQAVYTEVLSDYHRNY